MIVFRYPVTGSTYEVITKSQEFGDLVDVPNKVNLHKTMSGRPITTNKFTAKLQYTLTLKSFCDITEFIEFLDMVQGDDFLMDTSQGSWTGHIITRPLPIITELTGKGFTYTFEGTATLGDTLLLQTGDNVLLQTGDRILLEDVL